MEEIQKFKTCELMEELIKREAVQRLLIEPYVDFEINVNKQKQDLNINQGPVNILLIWD